MGGYQCSEISEIVRKEIRITEKHKNNDTKNYENVTSEDVEI